MTNDELIGPCYYGSIVNFVRDIFVDIRKHADKGDGYTLNISPEACKELAKDWEILS